MLSMTAPSEQARTTRLLNTITLAEQADNFRGVRDIFQIADHLDGTVDISGRNRLSRERDTFAELGFQCIPAHGIFRVARHPARAAFVPSAVFCNDLD